MNSRDSDPGRLDLPTKGSLGGEIDAKQAMITAFAANAPHATLDLEKTFYQNGGDSIGFLGFISDLSRLTGKELPFEDIDPESPLSNLVRLFQTAHEREFKTRSSLDGIRDLPLTGNRFAYLLPMSGDMDRWVHVSQVFDCRLKYCRARLDAAVQAIFDIHCGLSLRFKPDGQAFRQEMSDIGNEWLLERECPFALDSDDAKRFARATIREARMNISILERPLIVVIIWHADVARFWLTVLTHHALVDGLAAQIVQRDLATALEHVYSKGLAELRSTSASFSQYVLAYQSFCRTTQSSAIAHWEQRPWDAALALPLSRPKLAAHLDEIATHEIWATADRDDIARLEARLLTTSGPPLASLIISALARAYGRWADREFLYLAFVIHGRASLPNCPPLHETVGWLSDTVPIFVPTRGTIDQTIEAAREQITYATSSGISYNYLRYIAHLDGAQQLGLSSPEPMFSLNVRIGGMGRRPVPDFLSFFPMNLRPLGRRVFQMSGGAVLGRRDLRLSLDFNSITLDRDFVSQLLKTWVSECESVFQAFGGTRVQFVHTIDHRH